jgi:hypothetical protein
MLLLVLLHSSGLLATAGDMTAISSGYLRGSQFSSNSTPIEERRASSMDQELDCSPDQSNRRRCVSRVGTDFHSENRAGLYAIGPGGEHIQVTDFAGTPVGTKPLHELGRKYYDPTFKKVVIYAHGRQGTTLKEQVSNGLAFTDGFCREVGNEVHDFAASMRCAEWNTLLWYWAQYAYSPCGDVLEDHWLTCEFARRIPEDGEVVSGKIWADQWLRSQEDMSGGGNPKWAQFPEASRGSSQTYTWKNTTSNTHAADNITKLAVGFGFAESLLNIAPSLANVDALHFVGNSYGSQVVLHGSSLILKQLRQGRLGAIRSSGIPLPTRMVMLDPAYKAGATRPFGQAGHSIFWHLAVPQLKELHEAGVPIVSVHATDIPNTLVGTVDTAYFNYYALKVGIDMGLSAPWWAPWEKPAHTACVAWYFKTYLTHGNPERECVAPLTSVFGCAADADARLEIMEMLDSRQGVFLVNQAEGNYSTNPWFTSWDEKHLYRTAEDMDLLEITGCTSLSRKSSGFPRSGIMSQFKCIFPTEWNSSKEAYACSEKIKTVVHGGHEYVCDRTESRDSDKSLCKAWCNNIPRIQGCIEIARYGTGTVKCTFAQDNGLCEKTNIKHDNKTYACTTWYKYIFSGDCEATCVDHNELDLVPSTWLE